MQRATTIQKTRTMQETNNPLIVRLMAAAFFLSWIEHVAERTLSFMELPTPTFLVIYVSVLMFFYAVSHAVLNLGKRNFSVFLVVSVIVAWAFDTMKINSGLLEYSAGMGAKVFGVPFTLPLWFFILIYSAYFTTNLIFQAGPDSSIKKILLLSFVDGIVAASWFTMEDPINIALGNWKWNEAGQYFGSPVYIFFLWIATSFTASLIYRLYEKTKVPVSQLSNANIVAKYLPFHSYAFLALSASIGSVALKQPAASLVGFFASAPFVIIGFHNIYLKQTHKAHAELKKMN